MRPSDAYDQADDIGKGPMAWLRDNGRYLTPTGAGDYLYAAALAIRNWCAVHYVIGTILLAVLALVAFGRRLLAQWWLFWLQLETTLLERAQTPMTPDAETYWDPLEGFVVDIPAQPLTPETALFWWSPLWLLPAILAVVVLLPTGLAFWLTYPRAGGTAQDHPRAHTEAVIATALLSIAGLVTFFWWERQYGSQTMAQGPVMLMGAVAAVALLGVAVFVATMRGVSTIAEQRVFLTRDLAQALQWVLALCALALIDTLGQTLYLHAHSDWSQAIKPVALLGVGVYVVQQLARFLDGRQKASWLSQVPIDLIAGIAGLVLFMTVAMLWALL